MPARHAQTPLPALIAELSECQRALTEYLDDRENNLSAAETLLLAALERFDGRTPSELAGMLGLSRGRITHLSDRLSEHGFIERRPDRDDRRRVLIWLTAAGRPLGARCARRVGALEASLAGTLGPAGVDMLAQQLRLAGETSGAL